MYDRETMLVKVATMFYEEDYTQTKIAEELGISRPTIATLLDEAKKNGIVRVIISHPSKQIVNKQEILRRHFPNTNILVVAPINGNNDSKVAVGETAARLLATLLKDVKSIGIGWGSTIAEVVNAFGFHNLNHLSIIPIIGGVGFSDVKYHSNFLASELAQKVSGKINYLYAPAIADSQEIKDAFYRSELIRNILEQGKKVDLALIGLGNPTVNSNYQQHGYLTSEEIEHLTEMGTVGDILTSFFDSNGNIIHNDVSDRMIGLTIEDLEKIKEIVVVATGKEKAKSSYLILEKKLASHFVIDEVLADNIIELIQDDTNDLENKTDF